MKNLQLDEEAIFDLARKIDSPATRADYLDQVCGTDKDLKNRLAELFQAFDQEQSYLEQPALPLPATVESPVTEKPGDVIGHFKLLQKIGEGGFGVVYMAEQSRPVRRKVALKVIKPGMDTKEVIARFEAERQALAMMNHPNIAKVLDGSETESGRPYFVMELVKGMALNEFCDKQKLNTEQRLRLFVTVCSAIQHAHHKELIDAKALAESEADVAQQASAQAIEQKAVAEENAAKAVASAEKANLLGGTIIEMLKAAKPSVAAGATFTVRHLLDDFVVSLDNRLNAHPDVKAEIYHALGMTYWHLDQGGEMLEAASCFRKAVDLRRQSQDQLALADSLLRYSVIVGEPSFAYESLTIQEGVGNEDEQLATTHSWFAWLLSSRPGRNIEAEKHGLAALDLLDRIHSADPIIKIEAHEYLARALFYQQRFAEALFHSNQEFECLRTIDSSSKDSHRLGWGLLMRSRIQQGLGQLEAAEHSANEAVSLFRTIGVPAALSTSLAVLSRVQERRGKFSEAIANLSELLEIARETGLETRAASALIEKADILNSQGDYSGSKLAYTDAVEQFANSHFFGLIWAKMQIQGFLLRTGESSPNIPELQELSDKDGNESKKSRFRILHATSKLHVDPAGTITVAQRLLEPRSDELDSSWAKIEINAILCRCNARLGNLSKAVELFQRLHAVPPTGRIAGSTLSYRAAEDDLISALRQASELEQVIEVLRFGLKNRRETLPANHAQIAFCQLKLAKALAEKGQFSEAAQEAESAYDLLHGHEVVPAERAREAAQALVEILEAAGESKSAEKWRQVAFSAT